MLDCHQFCIRAKGYPLPIHCSKLDLINGYESEFWIYSGYREIIFSFTKALNLSIMVWSTRLPRGSPSPLGPKSSRTGSFKYSSLAHPCVWWAFVQRLTVWFYFTGCLLPVPFYTVTAPPTLYPSCVLISWFVGDSRSLGQENNPDSGFGGLLPLKVF